MLTKKFEIAILIAQFLSKSITDQELQVLEEWKTSSIENEQLFNRLVLPENRAELDAMASRYNLQEAWNNVRKQIIPERKSFLKWYYYAAAGILLPLLLFYFYRDQTTAVEKNLIVEATPIVNSITPGSSKATLTLADGSQVDLDEKKTFELEEKGNAKINKQSSVLNYQAVASAKETVYNQMYVPRGGEFSLVLSDGTKVFLNAMTSLRFPVNFIGDERRVELQGEAYFEVVKSDKPFIVETKDAAVRVLGTSFNVSSYPDDKLVQTTLVSGSVNMTMNNSKETVALIPSQQASFNKETGQVSVKKVEVSSYIAWKN